MVTIEYFTELSLKAYKFLEEKLGYSYIGSRVTPRNLYVEYKKDDLMVQINYSRVNDYLEVNVYNHISQVNPGDYKLEYSIMLLWLIYKENREFDYNSVMPKVIGLEVSLLNTAELLLYYGDSVLKGEEWVSNSMFTG